MGNSEKTGKGTATDIKGTTSLLSFAPTHKKISLQDDTSNFASVGALISVKHERFRGSNK